MTFACALLFSRTAVFRRIPREEWWTHPADRRYVLTETVKLAGYGVILRLPEAMVRRIMRLRHRVE